MRSIDQIVQGHKTTRDETGIETDCKRPKKKTTTTNKDELNQRKQKYCESVIMELFANTTQK